MGLRQRRGAVARLQRAGAIVRAILRVVDDADRDPWCQWIVQHRHGGDDEFRRELFAAFLAPLRDRLLDAAHIEEGDVVLDLGTGDGLIGFGALERAGPSGRVILNDLSADLLGLCRDYAAETGVLDRCRFVLGAVDDLREIDDASVDVVTIRSVLIYVKDKLASLRECYRVLRPGGRLALFEPINRFIVADYGRTFCGYDVSPIDDIVAKLEALYDSIQDPVDDPMVDFDERDLLVFVTVAGFDEVHLELRADIEPRMNPQPWERFLASSANPLVPTIGEAISQTLTAEEAAVLERHLRPLVEHGIGKHQMATALVRAVKHGEGNKAKPRPRAGP
jgi:ubiquinone/menaquinone biosynthesis C-methylase UbiE